MYARPKVMMTMTSALWNIIIIIIIIIIIAMTMFMVLSS